jgi:hypothetical protein
MDKPLKDWTAGEIQAECANHHSDCKKCHFGADIGCKLRGLPYHSWDLTDPPRFTPQEAEDAKVLMRMFPSCDTVFRSKIQGLAIVKMGTVWTFVDSNMFPSVKVGEIVSLKKIAGYTDNGNY